MEAKMRVAVVDPQPAVAEGIGAYLRRFGADPRAAPRLVASVPTIAELIGCGVAPDVAIVDLCLGEDQAAQEIARLAELGVRVLVYTEESRVVRLRRAVTAGAAGVVHKREPLSALPAALLDVVAGEFVCSPSLAHALLAGPDVPRLSARQVQVLRAIDEGLDRRAAARVLGISQGVVKTHLARIREKYQQHGVEPGNSHHLVHLAAVDGYLR